MCGHVRHGKEDQKCEVGTLITKYIGHELLSHQEREKGGVE